MTSSAFLAESVAITGAGSVIGAGLGLAAAFTWATLVIAVFVPALRASRLSPIDAMRHE